MKENIINILNSFLDYNYDMETIIYDWIIYFWDDSVKFLFEI